MQNPISREGYEKIREDIRRMEDDEMPLIAQRIATARAEGDLKENAEYHGQRDAQGLMQAKINQLKSKLASCTIVDKSAMPEGIVAFGRTVTVKDRDYGDVEKYEFVGPGEELASALVGKEVGAQVDVTLPNGSVQKLEVVAID